MMVKRTKQTLLRLHPSLFSSIVDEDDRDVDVERESEDASASGSGANSAPKVCLHVNEKVVNEMSTFCNFRLRRLVADSMISLAHHRRRHLRPLHRLAVRKVFLCLFE